MDEPSLSSISLLILLIVVKAFISLGYTAVMTERGLAADESNGDGKRLQLTAQFSTLLLFFSIGVIATRTWVIPLMSLATLPDWGVYLLVFVPLTLLVVIAGEVVPSTLGSAYREALAPIVRPFMTALITLLRPFTALLEAISRELGRVFGTTDVVATITEEELLTLIDRDPEFDKNEREMIHSVLELGETAVTEIMVPRIDIIAIPKTDTIAEARKVFIESGHSRLPVYEGNIDNIVGLLYVKDLLTVWHNGHTTVGAVAEIMRPMHFIPETMPANRLLQEFQRKKMHMAIVVEEYGGTSGLVTLENLLEEIVGDIQDEYDTDEVEDIIQIKANEYMVDGGVILGDLNEVLGVNLDDTDVDTLGGYILTQLERVPQAGEIVETEDLILRVEAIEGRRIRKVYVTKRETLSQDQAAEAREKKEKEALPPIDATDASMQVA
ncbi:MAG: hemolysin family protein [Phototrophicaceae bacterium]